MKSMILNAAMPFLLASSSVFSAAPPFVVPLPTVGVYDENLNQVNVVDFEAAGSTLSLARVHQLIGSAYQDDFGGVYQCELNSSGRYLVLKYGSNQTKILTLEGSSDLAFGVRVSGPDVLAISNGGLCGGPFSVQSASESLRFDSIANGLPGEQLVGLGLTLLSSGVDYGLVRAEASFSDGSSAVASRHIRESAGSGDVFYGFTAPPDASITALNITSPLGQQFWFDDVVFITATNKPVPDSGGTMVLLSMGLMSVEVLRRRLSR